MLLKLLNKIVTVIVIFDSTDVFVIFIYKLTVPLVLLVILQILTSIFYTCICNI